MKEILIFAGTTEGRKLSEHLAASGVAHRICVATEYGRIVLKEHPLVKVRQGRMDPEEIRQFIHSGDFQAVVDATHPYAQAVTRNIKAAAEGTKIPCFRLKREEAHTHGGDMAGYGSRYETIEQCVKALEHTEGNILLTTGSKELARYCVSEDVKRRLYVRVLPSVESISLCMEQGICGKQVIGMQGPFTVEMNEAMIRQYGIRHLVTKESGASGGYPEKLEAAEKTGARVYVIGRPEEDEGYSFSEICLKLQEICGKEIRGGDSREDLMCNTEEGPDWEENMLEIILAGVGMGSGKCMTKEVQEAVRSADILLGAERMLEHVRPGQKGYPFYRAEQILPFLKTLQNKEPSAEGKKVTVLFSGDSGFYSGCKPLYHALEQEVRQGAIRAHVRIMPGISSVAYLAACTGECYQDAAVYSMHGKELYNLTRRIKASPKTFLLMSGVEDVNRLGNLLADAGMSECEIVAGCQLSYKEQKIRTYTPQECRELREEGLYTCLVRNPKAVPKKLVQGIADKEFIRDRVPMTKEEVREVSISKLRLHDKAVVYDIGSGTGSVAVELAGLSDDVRVYAIERKKEAVSLIERNREKFGLQNITVVNGEAPEGLEGLPGATHAFIGGSGKRLKEILKVLHGINPRMRIVINAVSLETICEIREILSLYRLKEEEVIQIQVGRMKRAGDYRLMQAENPVWICAVEFGEEAL